MSGASGSSETENSTHDQGGDTDSVEDEDEEMSQSPPASQAPPLPPLPALPAVSLVEAWETNLRANQLIVKGVFSRILTRDEIVDVLRKKFSTPKKNLTGLKPSDLMAVLAKKLTRNEYCSLKVNHAEVKSKEDLTILKEIAF